LVDNIHRKSEQSDEQKDPLDFVVAQALVDLIFVSTGRQPGKITAVKGPTKRTNR
jgi:hypothetical protein